MPGFACAVYEQNLASFTIFYILAYVGQSEAYTGKVGIGMFLIGPGLHSGPNTRVLQCPVLPVQAMSRTKPISWFLIFWPM